MENYALEMRHIHKSFGPVHANNDVSLAVRKSKVHALIGENGAGKSTLMSILSNVLKPDSGEII
ncbi:MAG: ATP-binding cassette domain-containing protein, partial [Gracilibacteraceae bacterium]|nr:ATP-binding cassette domain-containing protein [Gracilibacteraceae bacterium]